MTMPIKALTFDTGGTILDWHHGLSRAFAAAGTRHGLQADWATLTNEYRRRSLQAMLNAEHPTLNIDDVHRQWGPSGPPDPVPNPAHDLVVDTFFDLAQQLGA